MSPKEILQELERMTNEERLEIIETATRLLRSDSEKSPTPSGRNATDREFSRAAQRMRDEYLQGGDLTAFSILDAEDFHDA